MTNTNKKTLIEAAITELHRVFYHLNNALFEGKLITPAIVIESKGKRSAYGWCSVEKIWADAEGEHATYELGIASEYLNRPYIEVMQTLLHEMIHVYCAMNEIKDTSRGYTYHNKNFKKQAELHGMEYLHDKPDSKIGFSAITLKPATRAIIENLELDAEAFKVARKNFDGTNEKKKSNSYKYECLCCGQSVRATKEVKLVCGECLTATGEVVFMICLDPPQKDGEDDGNEGEEGGEESAA
jgi:predicted SprT family Zn-dependent metalloprotease